MPDYRVVWNRPESGDRREQEILIPSQASPEHAAWEAAQQVFDCIQPSGRQLIRVEEVPEP